MVKQEGNPDEFFDDDCVKDKGAMDNKRNFLPEIDPEVFLSSKQARNIAMICNQGCDVDDNNKPALENVPDASRGCNGENAKKTSLDSYENW